MLSGMGTHSDYARRRRRIRSSPDAARKRGRYRTYVTIAGSRLQLLPVVDLLLAVAFVIGVTAVARQDDALGVGPAAFIVLAGAALAVRRLRPLWTLAAATAILGGYAAMGYPGGPIYVALLIAIYTVGTSYPRPTSLLLAGGATLAVFLSGVVGSGLDYLQGWIHLLFLSWVAAAVFLGDAVRSRGDYLASLRERARQAEETREQEAYRRVAEERLRIARDLHDIVGHSLATISVQAGAGLHVFERQPEMARDALLAVREASRDALSDLRRALDILRQEGEAPPTRPAPGLATVETLVENARRGGLSVELAIEGEAYPLPVSIDVTAFRIVQEAITNVLRHAGASTVRIALRYTPSHIELRVEDDGEGSPPGSPVTLGHGIGGMQERAASVGGVVEAGPRGPGGFAVFARLPRALAS